MEHMWDVLQSESARMSRWTSEFVHMAERGVDNPDLLVEVLGTLANMTLPNFPWYELCETGLVDLLHRLLVPSFSEDDIVLECVMLIGNIALQRDSAQHLAGSRLPSMLQDILYEKRDDEEIVLQMLYTFHCLLIYEEVREVILEGTDIAACTMRFARSKNAPILEQAMATLQLVADHAGCDQDGTMSQWSEQIKAFRFEYHNQVWCNHAAREMNGGGGSPSIFNGEDSPVSG